MVFGVRSAAAVSGGMGLVLACLYSFSPAESSWYWRCPIHELTGLLCPGCGGTRSIHALLHGRLSEALAWNPLGVVLFVLFGVVLLLDWHAILRSASPAPTMFVSGRHATIMAALIIVFSIFRNVVRL